MNVPDRAGHGEGENILRNRGAAANIRVSANAHELVYRAKRAYHSPFFHGDVPGERGCIHQHGVIANLTIMPDVGIGHDENMAANPGNAAAFIGAAIDGHILADDVVLADFEPGWFTAIGDVLRLDAKRGEWKDPIVIADLSRPLNYYVRHELAMLTEFHIGTNKAKRANRTGTWNAS